MADTGLKIVIGADISEVTTALKMAGDNVEQFGNDLKDLPGLKINISDDVKQAAVLIGRVTDNLEELSDTGVGNIQSIKSALSELREAAKATGDVKELATFNKAIKDLSSEQGRLTKLGTDVKSTSQAIESIQPSANKANNALINLGRVVQDAPFGFTAISNNINPLLESFQRLKTETGTTSGALKALGSGLLGGAGLGLAVSLATSLLVTFGDQLFKTSKDADALTKSQDELQKSLKSISSIQGEGGASVEGQLSQVAALAAAVSDSNKPYAERKRALEELKEVNKNYFGDLKIEDALTGKLTATVTEYTNALVNSAIQKQFVEEIATVAKKVSESDETIRKSREKLSRAQQDAANAEAELGKVIDSNKGLRQETADLRLANAVDKVNTANKAVLASEKDVQDANDLSTKGLEQEAVLRDNLNKTVAEGLKFKDLDSNSTKKVNDGLDKQLQLLEKIRDERLKNLGNLFDLKEIDPAVDKLQSLIQTIGNLKLQIALRDAQKAKLPAAEIEKLKDSIKANTQKDLNALFSKEAILLEGSPNLKFSQPLKVEIPNNANFFKVDDKRSNFNLNDIVSKAVGLDKKIPTITIPEANIKLFGIKQGTIINETKKIVDDLNKKIEETIKQGIGDGLASIGQAFGEALSSGDFGAGLKKAAQSILNILGGVLEQIGKQVITAAIAIKALKTTIEKFAISNPELAIAAGIGLVALGSVLENVKFAGPKFAEGGIVSGPVIGQVGERFRPEVVLPLDRLPQLFKQIGGDTGGGTQLIPIINNEGLYLAMKRGERSAGRKF